LLFAQIPNQASRGNARPGVTSALALLIGESKGFAALFFWAAINRSERKLAQAVA
jgi:hypothetical protein